MSKKKILLLLAVLSGLSVFFIFDLQAYFRPDFFRNLYLDSPLLTATVFFSLYVLAAALSIPAATLLTVIGGMIFGLVQGTVLVSFASTIGATLAFLFARTLLRDWVQSTLASQLKTVNRGLSEEGALYLFSLRLIPVVPFWVINLAMGVTVIQGRTFFLVSQLGMLPATLVYVNAGAELGAVDEFSLAGILTPGLVFSFVLLGLFPFIARYLTRVVKQRWLKSQE